MKVLLLLFLFVLMASFLLLVSLLKDKYSPLNQDSNRGHSLLLKLPAIFVIFALTLAPYFSSGSLVTRMGVGPDTSQNIMAAQEYVQRDNTSFESINSQLLQITDSTEVESALTKLRTLPNVRDQAFFDYSISGFRSVIVSMAGELLRIIGPSNVLLLQVIILIVILLLLCLSVLAASYLVNWNNLKFHIAVLVLAINPLTILLFLNGAWAQLLSLPFLIVLVSLYISLRSNLLSSNFSTQLRALLLTLFLTVLGSLVYIESAVVFLPFSIMILALIFRKMQSLTHALFSFLIGFLCSIIIALPVIEPLKTKLSQGLSGYSSTGLDSNTHFSPLNLVGLGNFDSNWILGRQSVVFVFLTTIAILVIAIYFLLRMRKSSLEFFLILLICIFSLLNCSNLLSTYTVMKFSYEVLPILLVLSLNRIPKKIRHFSLGKGRLQISNLAMMSIVSFALLTSSIVTTSNVISNSSFWKKADDQVFKSSFFETEVSRYPFFTTYIPSATWFGLIGDFNWVNKFPNVINLEEFSDEKIRIICFDVDPNCVPSATEIPSKLNRFGLKIWITEYSAGQFQKLSPDERMELSLKLMGQGSFNYSR